MSLINSCIDKKLDQANISWLPDPCITIVAASNGYPGDFKKLDEINNLPDNKKFINQQIFHAGTIKRDNKILSNGGRVLNSTVSSSNLKSARNKALELLDQIEWKNKYYRRDIGWRAIK